MSTQSTLIKLAIGAGVAWGLYQLAKNWPNLIGKIATDLVLDPLKQVGGKIGSGIYDAFHPASEQVGEQLYYTPTFPDGKRHAVGSMSVAQDGTFKLPAFYGSTLFRLMTDRVSKLRVAVPVPR